MVVIMNKTIVSKFVCRALCTHRFPNLCFFSNRPLTVKCVYCSVVKMLSDGGDEDVQPQRSLFIASR